MIPTAPTVNRPLLIIGLLICISLSSCSRSSRTPNRLPRSQPTPANVFDAFMVSDIPPADGFDFAVGDVNGRGRYADKSSGTEFEGWVDHESYRLRFYQQGALRAEYDVAFGQGRGQKLVEGDNKTPKGMYFVIQKHRGTFDQPYGEYYGGHWIKINYPNKYDADRGREQQMISSEQHREIVKAWYNKQATPQNTALGGGIGFHGWNQEWENSGPRHLSWGCVVMHLSDIGKFYDQIPEGTMVVIF